MLASLEGLELRARSIVDGYLSGLHRSPHYGFSVEFAQHREYAPGDDVRHVDWKVFGKTDKLYLKQYEEETNLACYLLLDVSESMLYRSTEAPLSKLEYAQCIGAALSHLILRQQDSVGLATFDREIRTLVRPAGGDSQWKQIVQAMEGSRAERKTSAGPIFHELAERFRTRGMVVVLSDLFDDLSSVLSGLQHFRHNRHEVVVLHVLDPAELDFNFREATLFRGLEQAPDVLTDPRSVRKAYLSELGRFLLALRRGCREQGIDYDLLRTDQPLDLALSSYLSSRSHRTRRERRCSANR